MLKQKTHDPGSRLDAWPNKKVIFKRPLVLTMEGNVLTHRSDHSVPRTLQA